MENTDSSDLLGALECLLFAAADPLTPAELAEMLEVEPARVAELAAELTHRCAGRGLQIVQVAGGYQMCTRPEYGRFIARLHEPERFRLSRAALETLAIVAYRQPATRPEIEAIRGVNVDGVISTLLQYRLIRECGRKDAPGRPMLYGTTEDFLQHFGLNTVRDLPELDTLPVDLSAEASAKVDVVFVALDDVCHNRVFFLISILLLSSNSFFYLFDMKIDYMIIDWF